MGTNAIEGKQYTLGDVFGEQFVFEIPNYQRPYAWGREQTEELLDDLLHALGENEQTPFEQRPPYFLGSIVLIKNVGRKASVIDGQQRITTLTLLFTALRYTLQDKDLVASMAECVVQKGNKAKGIPDEIRLTLRARDHKFFREEVVFTADLSGLLNQQTELENESQTHVRENLQLLVARLLVLSESRRQQLACFLLQRCLMVVVTTDNRESAVRIFSVLNSRGLDLSSSDILKSELLDLADLSDSDSKEFTASWEAIEENIGRDAFQDFFSHLRMLRVRKRAEKEIIDEFRRLVVPSEPVARRLFITEELFDFANAYEYVVLRNYKSSSPTEDEKIATALFWLRYVDNFDWIPAAVLAFKKLREKPSQLALVLAAIERIASTMVIRRCDINTRVRRFADVLDALDAPTIAVTNTRLELDVTECKETLDQLNADLYRAHRNVQRLVLCRLDDLLSAAPPSAASKEMHRSLTIEHVLPQTVDFTNTNPGQWGAWYTAKTHEQTVHKLGNLVLLTRNKNSAASNYDFATKKTKYFQGKGGSTPFALTVQVLAEPSWEPAVFQKHHDQRIQALKKAWSL